METRQEWADRVVARAKLIEAARKKVERAFKSWQSAVTDNDKYLTATRIVDATLEFRRIYG